MLEVGLAGTFRTNSVRVAQVILETVDSFRVHCDFPTHDDEIEFFEMQAERPLPDRIEALLHMGGSGRITLIESESGAHIEIFASVRALAPALREAADAFEARLAELPNS